MKQLALSLRTGKVQLREVPAPVVKKGYVLIRTRRSVISQGTERMLVSFGKAPLLSKVFKQPEHFHRAIQKIKTQGLASTLEMLSNRLDQLMPLGYCQLGEVIAVGEGVRNLRTGDRVISNGCHAEVVCVAANLVAKVPESVQDEQAAFTVLAAIGLQGIRLLSPALGEVIAVIGLGLIGQLTVTLLRANGCRVIGVERDEKRAMQARAAGLVVLNPIGTSIESQIAELTGGHGVDGVIITASATSDEILSQAARISRKRGKIVVVGAIGMHVRRPDFYEKELTLQVSCSYGPGRYDPKYEEQGADYSFPFVRWTENRNFIAVLDLLESEAVDFKSVVYKKIKLEDAANIYEQNLQPGNVIMIEYPAAPQQSDKPAFTEILFKPTEAVIGIIGAGNFARQTLLPQLKGAAVKYIASANGLSASELAGKYRIPHAITDYQNILRDTEVDLVVITTRHNMHAGQVIHCLEAGKHVFVEKPLALNPGELDQIIEAWKLSGKMITVGFNRRFSPFAVKMRELLGDSLMHVIITINAGQLPETAWQKNLDVGGGRIIGECCHFVDLLSFITRSPIAAVCSCALPSASGQDQENVSTLFRMLNGSTGVINYFATGHHAYQKERIEVHSGGRTLILDDFKCLTGYGFKGFRKMKSTQDKGHRSQFKILIQSVKNGGIAPISMQDLIHTTKATFAVVASLTETNWISV